ncbi:rhodanese-like domain-containing protein [Rubripirellula reticaptiva]|uniref:Putative adenylyltransferase/sulfurtransferase MoeZ n=1 Tax=Rubripirellula reticaptiva TaxID=2528013 RepID=A0A5C6FBY7_9BACT|nr:rhodanese-like domain-containing protein [Rubripirellula reticaptiva]TWU58302.1 putative adenylyltransferase/sulfurtransferase MoeZ [Rubripirellula reticaptiva]
MADSNDLPLEIDVATLAAMKERGETFVLLDVREQDEYDFAKIDGSLLLPMSELPSRLDELDMHRNDHIVVHCHHGGRSLHVTKVLQAEGFGRVQNLAGGIDDWSLQIDTGVPRY